MPYVPYMSEIVTALAVVFTVIGAIQNIQTSTNAAQISPTGLAPLVEYVPASDPVEREAPVLLALNTF